MVILTVVLIGVCIILAIQYIRSILAIRSLRRQLEEIERGSHMEIGAGCRQREVLALCGQLNRLRQYWFQNHRQYEKAEKQLKQNITGLAHDIRTPLTSIIGHLDAVYYQYVHGEMNAESVRQAPITGHCPIGQALSFCQELKHKSKKHCIGTVMNLSLR